MRLVLAAAASLALAALFAPSVLGAIGSSADADEPPTFWNTLLFDSWRWEPVDGVGFGGVALWALIVLVAACVGFRAAFTPTMQVAGAATAFITVWSLVPRFGPLTEIGLPAVAGLLAAWYLTRHVDRTRDVSQALLVATIVGAFAGDLLAWGIRALVDDAGVLRFGNRRFVDEIFTLPGFGLLGFVLFKVLPEIARAQDADDDRTGSPQRGPMQADKFEVRCLRCQTDIKVDRSMKRFRVATDRFEFACPNCQYWMEWADPNAKGAAAA